MKLVLMHRKLVIIFVILTLAGCTGVDGRSGLSAKRGLHGDRGNSQPDCHPFPDTGSNGDGDTNANANTPPTGLGE